MVLNWGKAVKINSTPVSVPVRNPPLPPIPPPAIDPLISTPVIQTTPELVITTKIEGTASSSASKWDALPATPATMTVSDPRIVVTVPQDPRTRQIIDLMAKFVAADGDAFERVS